MFSSNPQTRILYAPHPLDLMGVSSPLESSQVDDLCWNSIQLCVVQNVRFCVRHTSYRTCSSYCICDFMAKVEIRNVGQYYDKVRNLLMLMSRETMHSHNITVYIFFSATRWAALRVGRCFTLVSFEKFFTSHIALEFLFFPF